MLYWNVNTGTVINYDKRFISIFLLYLIFENIYNILCLVHAHKCFSFSQNHNFKMNMILFRPDLIEFHKLTRSNATHNLQQAFNIAEQSLGLTKLLDPEGKV